MVKYVSTCQGYTLKKRSAKDLFEDVYVIFFFFIKSIFCEYSFELHQLELHGQVDAIQMGTHTICLLIIKIKQWTKSTQAVI